jgi:hypothetical protein
LKKRRNLKKMSKAKASPGERLAQEGFYAREFNGAEIRDLEALRGRLVDEIAALRVTARRMLELSRQVDDPRLMMETLSALGMLLSRIGGLLRTQAGLAGEDGALEDEITQAIREVSNAMGWPPENASKSRRTR